jgi:dihydrofolate reductase
MEISIIVAVDKNWLIGRGDTLPWTFKEDLEYFKEKTMGKYVIMGEKTYLGINKKLQGRKIIVLSRDKKYFEDAFVASSIEEALSLGEGEIMIAGGKSVYAQFLEIANRIYLTIIDEEFEGDVYFPDFDKNEWKEVEEKRGENPLLSFKVLEKKN